MRIGRLGLLIGLLATTPAPLAAQPRARFVEIEVDGSVEDLVRERLGQAQEMERLRKLAEQFFREAGKLQLDPERFQRELKGPAGQQLLERLGKSVGDKPPSREELKKLEKLLQQSAAGPGGQPPPALPVPPKSSSPPAPPAPPREEGVSRWTEELLRQMEDSDLGLLRDSPGFQRALERMQETAGRSDALPRWNAERWFDRLGTGDLPWRLGERVLDRLSEVDWPERWNANLPKLGRWNAPRLPRSRGLPSVPQVQPGRATVVVLLLALVALLGWRLWPRSAARRSRVNRTELGPWPVRPDSVATRAELIAVFDYLAVLTLGRQAESWNHRQVARQWQRDKDCAAPARIASKLYEAARYTVGPALLSEAEAQQARQALCSLQARLAS